MNWRDEIPALISRRFPGAGLTELSRRTGIPISSLHRIVNGGPGGPPSFENLMRLCQAVGEHPARWFAAAGHVEMAYFLR
ncbi:MAG TPA: helix-turn-helix transcriptional regulator, partial [Acidobacteriota bacterium]|nr:helix-turn-helix transcriptional regulator [Acidobacteriota bacterium]